MTQDSSVAGQLEAMREAVGKYDDPRRASAEWKQIYRILQKSPLAERQYQGVVGRRDLPGLDALIEQLRSAQPSSESPAGDESGVDAATCRKALQAFRKRARLTRLDDESKLGHSPLSKGSDDRLGAITLPAEFADEVWQALLRQGRIRSVGHGLYELNPDRE